MAAATQLEQQSSSETDLKRFSDLSQIRINSENRDSIQYRYIRQLVEGMDVQALIDHVLSSLEVDYNHYSNTELENEILDWYGEDFEWEVEN